MSPDRRAVALGAGRGWTATATVARIGIGASLLPHRVQNVAVGLRGWPQLEHPRIDVWSTDVGWLIETGSLSLQ